jgi:hypothetical protein
MKLTEFLDADEAAETPRPLTVTSNSGALRWENISHDSEGPFDKLDKTADWDDIFVYGANYTKLDRPPDSKTLVAYKRPGAESDYSVKILKDNPHVAVVHSDMCGLPTGGKQNSPRPASAPSGITTATNGQLQPQCCKAQPATCRHTSKTPYAVLHPPATSPR